MSTTAVTNTAQPALLNTSYFNVGENSKLAEYFASSSKLGSYSTIEVRLNSRELVQIVVDQSFPWLQEHLNSYFSKEVKKLNLKQIEEFSWKLSSEKSNAISFLGLSSSLSFNKGLGNLYLDELAASDAHNPLIVALITQILIEKYTNRDSRIAVVQKSYGEDIKKAFVVLVRSKKNIDEFSVLDPSKVFPAIAGKSFTERFQYVEIESKKVALFEIVSNDFKIIHSKYAWSSRNKTFSIFGGNGKELNFEVAGRTPTEKRFCAEEEKIQKSENDEMVPIEIGFHPFWRILGHTTVRVGLSLFELTAKGWKSHQTGSNSARAYLFNNPYFRTQFDLYKKTGMPPVSIAVNVQVTKSQAVRLLKILEQLSTAKGKDFESFSLWTNNCNQGIMRVLEKAMIPGFSSKGYMGFSSVLSFRKLLLFPILKVNARYIYPLPQTEITEANLRLWMPKLIYRHNTIAREFFRAMPALWINACLFALRHFNEFIYRVFKIRFKERTGIYHMQ